MRKTAVLLSIVLLFLPACSTLQREPVRAYPKPLSGWDEALVEKYTEMEDGELVFMKEWKASLSEETDPEVLRRDRNAIVGELMLIAKAVHREIDTWIYYGRATFDVLTDFTQLVSTAVASVAGDAATKSALAAFATASEGIQQSVDQQIFADFTSLILLSTSKTLRQRQEIVLIQKMDLPVHDYSLEQALLDVVDYLLAGNVTDALQELSSSSAEDGRAVEKELTEVRIGG